MRLPRDVSGRDLARRLRRYGYEQSRQTGSHMRLTRKLEAQVHHVTVPDHDELRIGTLRAILGDVATELRVELDVLVEALFG